MRLAAILSHHIEPSHPESAANVCYRAALQGVGMAVMVKVFGCRQAYENRPCTNPRGCGDGLWGFRVLPGLCGFGTGSVLGLAGTWRGNFSATRTVDREPAA